MGHKTEPSTIYLTFDDGPSAHSTDQILDVLDKYAIDATFFCLISQAEKAKKAWHSLRSSRHQIASHGDTHLSYFKTSRQQWLEDIERGIHYFDTSYYRPPYGHFPMNKRYRKNLGQMVMWSIMPGDFDTKRSAADCISKLKKHVGNGSIIVLHDQDQLASKVRNILEDFIPWALAQGYQFKTVSDMDSIGMTVS